MIVFDKNSSIAFVTSFLPDSSLSPADYSRAKTKNTLFAVLSPGYGACKLNGIRLKSLQSILNGNEEATSSNCWGKFIRFDRNGFFP